MLMQKIFGLEKIKRKNYLLLRLILQIDSKLDSIK